MLKTDILRQLAPNLEALTATLIRAHAPRTAKSITQNQAWPHPIDVAKLLPLTKQTEADVVVTAGAHLNTLRLTGQPELLIQLMLMTLKKVEALKVQKYELVEQFNFGFLILPFLWLYFFPGGKWFIARIFAFELKFHPYLNLITGIGSIMVYRRRQKVTSDAVQISCVIPAFNEEQRLPKYLEQITRYLRASRLSHEILVVDDGSHDATIKRARAFKNVRVLKLFENFGKGAAVREGVLTARGAQVLVTDADGSTPIDDVKKLREAIEAGADIAIGSRYVPGSDIAIKQNLLRRIISRSGNFLIRRLLGLEFRDTQCGFKLFDRRAAQYLFRNLANTRFGFDFEILKKADVIGLNVAEVPVRWSNVDGSKVTMRQTLRVLRDLLRFRFGHLFKFALIGVVNTLIDFAVHNALILTFGVGNAVRQLAYMVVAFFFANIIAFSLHSGYTFKRRAAYLRFFLVSAFTLMLAAVLFHGLNLLYNPQSSVLLTNVLKLSTVLVSFATNYFGYKFWVYRYAV